MTNYRGKKRACWPSSARAWQGSMDISFGSMPPRQINAHVDKQEKLWTTFSFDVGSGLHTGQKCCNVPTLTEVTCPSSWEGSHPPMIKSGSRIWKQCEPQYDLRSLRADSRPPRLADKLIEYLFLLTNPQHLVTDGRRASTAEDRMLNT